MNDEGPAKFDVSVKIHHTRYTETHLAAAVNEKQKISLNSEYEPEIQVKRRETNIIKIAFHI